MEQNVIPERDSIAENTAGPRLEPHSMGTLGNYVETENPTKEGICWLWSVKDRQKKKKKRKTGVATLISEKIDFKIKAVTR